jgi:prepilin-type N-terminal cleavage/methylation domain-containing protein
MKSIVRNQNGFTLIELVVTIILLGVTLPAIFGLIGQVAFHSSRQAIKDQAVLLAEEKIEEIIGLKESDWDWYKDPTRYEDDEDLADNFSRSVSVSAVSSWGGFNLDAWQIDVVVTHPQLTDGYQLSVRFTTYWIQDGHSDGLGGGS